MEAFNIKISIWALGFINVDVYEFSRVLHSQIVGRFIELVDGVMQVSSTSSDLDPFLSQSAEFIINANSCAT